MIQLGKDLYYDDATHTYEYCGMSIPSVTTIQSAANPIPAFIRNKESFAMLTELGRAIHDCTERDDRDQERLSESEHYKMDGVHVKADMWQDFKVNAGIDVLEIEMGVVNAEWWYAGRLDRIVRLEGFNYVLDIKSGKLSTRGRQQVAAYVIALKDMDWKDENGNGIDGGILMSLKEDTVKTSFIKEQQIIAWMKLIKRYNGGEFDE